MFWIIDDIIIALWCCETAGKFNNNFPLVSSGIERRGEKWNKENFRVVAENCECGLHIVERGGKVDFMAVWAINYWIDSFCFFCECLWGKSNCFDGGCDEGTFVRDFCSGWVKWKDSRKSWIALDLIWLPSQVSFTKKTRICQEFCS